MNVRTHISRVILLIAICTCAGGGNRPCIAQPPVDDLRIRIFPGGVINDLGQETFSLTELSPTVFVDEVSGEVRGQVDRVDQFVKSEQWSEAIEMLIRLHDRRGRKLAKAMNGLEGDFVRYIPIQPLVREQLAVIGHASPAAMRQYRARVDPLAEQWLSEGVQAGDDNLLRKIVHEAFHSSAGDEALLALGDRAFEAGDHTRARRYWQAIHANLQWQHTAPKLPYWKRVQGGDIISSVGKDLVADRWHQSCYLDSDIPLEDIWARLILSSILEGDAERAAAEISILRALWPTAVGEIGGRKTNYLTVLSDLFKESRSWPLAKPSNDWKTFAGNSQRNRLSATVIDIPAQPAWRVALHSMPTSNDFAARIHNLPRNGAGEPRRAPRSHFPIVVSNMLLVHDAHRIRCLDLRSGEPAWSGSTDGAFFNNAPRVKSGLTFSSFGDQQRPVRLGEQRFTLTASDATLVAAVGSHQGIGGSGNPALIGFDLSAEGSVQFGPIELPDRWSFHGAPLCDENRCWVGLRLRDVSAQDFIASYDTRTGEELWRTRICSADTIGHESVEEVSNYLLTKHEDTLYFSSHLGTVAAVSATDGSILWLTKYLRTGPKRSNLLDEPFYALRDLTPCVFHDDMLIVCPSDSPKIFALQADSGDLIWETELGHDATQMLGVGEDDHLIVTGRRVWWIDVYTGQPSEQVAVNPFPSGTATEPKGAGRGLLSGGKIYWPSVEDRAGKIYVLDQSDGKAARQPIDLEVGGVSPGNLVLTPSYLLIASSEELAAYQLVDGSEVDSTLKEPDKRPGTPAPTPRK